MANQQDQSYKSIQVPLSTPLTEEERGAIAGFNEHFHHSDACIVSNGVSLEVRLREMDMNELDRLISNFDKGNNFLLQKISEEVRSIGNFGIRSGKRVFVGYNRERKVKNRAKKEANRGKYYYAKDFSKQNKSFPEAYENKIICGDSLEVLKKLPSNCVDLVFTSPPYNFGLDYADNPDDVNWSAYFDTLFEIFDECIRVLKYGGRIVVNVQPLFSDYIPSHHMISAHFIKRGLIWKGEILWEKNNYNCKYTAWGSWKSPSNPYLKYTWEFLEVFCKGSLKKEGDKENADVLGDDFKKWVYGKWSLAPERSMKEYGHPAMFPESLAKRAVQLFSFQGDLVLDPFVGAGTTAVVAKKTGRRWLGVDISPEYCETAEKRLLSAVDSDYLI